MFRSCVVLLLFPGFAAASCGTHRIQYYDLLIRENRYSDALHLILSDLDATGPETRAFKISPMGDDDRGEALSLSPSVLQAGKSTACQQAASLLVHVRQRNKDRAQVTAYHRDWVASRKGWAGCEIDGKNLDQPEQAAAIAFQCLEDPALETHQAATEIKALMAKAAAGDVHRLSDEDAAVLQQQLGLFHEGRSVFDDKSTDSYYLPEIKRADRQIFCQALTYARSKLHLKNEETAHWQTFCLQSSPTEKP